jgi:phage tail sheath protein FI
MAVYKTPNVYVEEISTLPPSVAGVSTAIPAFIGYTEKAIENGVSLTNTPVRISTLLEYEEFFGGPEVTDFSTVKVNVTDDQVVGSITIDPVQTPPLKNYMHHSVRMYYDNGGGPCYIVSVGTHVDQSASFVDIVELKLGLDALALEDEPTLIVSADATFFTSSVDYKTYTDAVLLQCETLKDRFGVFDVRMDINNPDIRGDAKEFRDNAIGTSSLKYGTVYYPYIETALTLNYDETLVTVEVDTIDDTGSTPTTPFLSDLSTGNTAIYNLVKAKLDQLRATLPPSPAMVGVYAKVDREIGVWKAPANVSVASAIRPIVKISDADQEDLNVDATAGKSINAIRTFTGKGTLIWGARTLSGNDNEWRYVPVRRLFNFVEESIQKATGFAVFEPNTAITWLKINTLISSFLTSVWQQGGLAGASAEQAFFVNVGLGTTMTSQDILEGRMIVEIGIAAVRPAEFIILRFSHKLQEA